MSGLCRGSPRRTSWFAGSPPDLSERIPPEGTNNKTKFLLRQAFGDCDEEFFKLRLLGLRRSRHA